MANQPPRLSRMQRREIASKRKRNPDGTFSDRSSVGVVKDHAKYAAKVRGTALGLAGVGIGATLGYMSGNIALAAAMGAALGTAGFAKGAVSGLKAGAGAGVSHAWERWDTETKFTPKQERRSKKIGAWLGSGPASAYNVTTAMKNRWIRGWHY